MPHNTEANTQPNLSQQTTTAIMEDSIRDLYGIGEVKKDIQLRSLLGSVAVEPDDLLPALTPELPIERVDLEKENSERIKNEHQQNVNLMFRLANLLPKATYKLNNTHRGEKDVFIEPQEDPYLSAAVKESIIWVKSAYGSMPYVCYGSKTEGRKTQLLLINLQPKAGSTEKWAQWTMEKIDPSGTTIPLRSSGFYDYEEHEIKSGKISTKKWNEFQETLPSRIHKRWLADQQYYSTSDHKRSEDPIRFDENSFRTSIRFDYNIPFIDNDCAERFQIAQNMARLSTLFDVSETFKELCDRIDSRQ
jgi:hypothetical protein